MLQDFWCTGCGHDRGSAGHQFEWHLAHHQLWRVRDGVQHPRPGCCRCGTRAVDLCADAGRRGGDRLCRPPARKAGWCNGHGRERWLSPQDREGLEVEEALDVGPAEARDFSGRRWRNVLVTVQGANFMGERFVDCPGTSVDCAGHVTDISPERTAVRELQHVFGATPGQTTFVIADHELHRRRDWPRDSPSSSATQRYAVGGDQIRPDGQNPTLPEFPRKPAGGCLPPRSASSTPAWYRNAASSVWADTGEVFRSTRVGPTHRQQNLAPVTRRLRLSASALAHPGMTAGSWPPSTATMVSNPWTTSSICSRAARIASIASAS